MHDVESFDRVLDLGGWFIPNNDATHVVDLMPYETRRVAVTPDPLPEERFSKETWHQADFLKKGFKLPYVENYFDYVTCGHTIEDLESPEALIDEMVRVARAGIIRCPSRLMEQTIGIDGRESKDCGYGHHHWIVDVENETLVLYKKSDSNLSDTRSQIPLIFSENMVQANREVEFEWRDGFQYKVVTGPACAERARSFASSLAVGPLERAKDSALRLARRIRTRMRGGAKSSDWWQDIVRKSQPYTTIPIS